MLALLAELPRRHGAAVILVTHDKDATAHADRVLEMRDGRLTEGARETATAGRAEDSPGGAMIERAANAGGFYRRHLRVQPLRELMAIAGVAAGVALLFSVQVAHRSIVGSFEEVAHGVAGHATLELAARSPEGFPSDRQRSDSRCPASRPPRRCSRFGPAVGPHGERALTLVGADRTGPRAARAAVQRLPASRRRAPSAGCWC